MLYFAASPFISNSPSSKDKDNSMLEASGNAPVNPWTLFPFLLYRLLPTFLAMLSRLFILPLICNQTPLANNPSPLLLFLPTGQKTERNLLIKLSKKLQTPLLPLKASQGLKFQTQSSKKEQIYIKTSFWAFSSEKPPYLAKSKVC